LLSLIYASGAYEVRVARDEAERMMIWKGRKSAFSAVGRLSPDYIVNDGVVPRSRLGHALSEIDRLGKEHDPRLAHGFPATDRLGKTHAPRLANVSHAGDGTLHPLILYNGREPGALERAEALAGEILRLCIRLGGSITGEHGVGMEKRNYLPEMFNATDM